MRYSDRQMATKTLRSRDNLRMFGKLFSLVLHSFTDVIDNDEWKPFGEIRNTESWVLFIIIALLWISKVLDNYYTVHSDSEW